MSRILIKNLPNGITKEKLQATFSEVGEITDCALKFTKDGVFRKFAFIGYKSEEDASAAIKYFNRSYINTSQISVDIAKDLGDVTKPQSWSKYSKDSSAYRRNLEKSTPSVKSTDTNKKALSNSKKKDKKSNKIDELLGDLKDDAEFKEFLEAHKGQSNKAFWSNDAQVEEVQQGTKAKQNDAAADEVEREKDEEKTEAVATVKKKKKKKKRKQKDGETTGSVDQQKVNSTKQKDNSTNPASQKELSDLEYLRLKKVKSISSSPNEDDNNEEDDYNDGGGGGHDGGGQETPTTTTSTTYLESESGTHSADTVLYLIKMRGLPAKVTKKQIEDFFRPLITKKIKMPNHANGIATVEFNCMKDWEQAARKNKNYIGSKRIFLHKLKEELKQPVKEVLKPWQLKLQQKKSAGDEDEETIAESGRIFIRNLPHTCTEEDLEKLFETFGPLSEVHLPINYFTRKNKGFAFVTYLMPEHAVQAYTKLDGTSFQGKLLHLLPAQEKVENEEGTEGSSFKKQKELKQKKAASSSHNWNSLFLSTNAVVDVMAERYGASKSQILDVDSKQSLGVRLALGETQVVTETRKFLVDNGVVLDSFSQAGGARSKTVILVKNLPADTKDDEITKLFSPFGHLGRVLLPPSGVTAIVEFVEPAEARNAFRNLAYTKFQYTPLYLEWAPVDVFGTSTASEDVSMAAEGRTTESTTEQSSDAKSTGETATPDDNVEQKATHSGDESSGDEDSEPGSVLFVKNLSFDTTEDTLTKAFSVCGKLRKVTVSKKKDLKNAGRMLSMGYGFVEYRKASAAEKALKQLQHMTIDGHDLELKLSNRETAPQHGNRKKQDTKKKQKSTKILIRNIPFEANLNEVRELFTVFGEIKSIRLPKKLSASTSSHRGFGFVDFLTLQDAKRAFNALCHSTHLYGRRLVLEWAETVETVDQLRKKTAQHFYDDHSSKRLKKSALLDELNPSRNFS